MNPLLEQANNFIAELQEELERERKAHEETKSLLCDAAHKHNLDHLNLCKLNADIAKVFRALQKTRENHQREIKALKEKLAIKTNSVALLKGNFRALSQDYQDYRSAHTTVEKELRAELEDQKTLSDMNSDETERMMERHEMELEDKDAEILMLKEKLMKEQVPEIEEKMEIM